MGASLAIGSLAIPLRDVVAALTQPDGSDAHAIVTELRVPRTILGLLVGAALGAAGALLQGKKPADRKVQDTGRTETVAGIKCAIWEVIEDGNKREELCSAQPGAVPGGDEVIKTFREIGATMQSFTENLGTVASNQPWHDMDAIKGVPILTREFSNGKPTSEMRVASVRKQAVPAAQFAVPAGYTEKKLEFGPGQQ
jgi:hypothetical protein